MVQLLHVHILSPFIILYSTTYRVEDWGVFSGSPLPARASFSLCSSSWTFEERHRDTDEAVFTFTTECVNILWASWKSQISWLSIHHTQVWCENLHSAQTPRMTAWTFALTNKGVDSCYHSGNVQTPIECPHAVLVTDGLVRHDFQLYPRTKREAPSRASNHGGYLPDIVLHL